MELIDKEQIVGQNVPGRRFRKALSERVHLPGRSGLWGSHLESHLESAARLTTAAVMKLISEQLLKSRCRFSKAEVDPKSALLL